MFDIAPTVFKTQPDIYSDLQILRPSARFTLGFLITFFIFKTIKDFRS